jgi:hypothetical protein
MTSPRNQLLSWPFVLLYLATIGSVILHFTAPKLGMLAWFPIAVGIVGGFAVFALRHLSVKAMTHATQGRWWRVALFLFMPALTVVGICFMDRHDVLLICTSSIMSVVFLAAAVATAFNLPPLQTGRIEGRCPKCRCRLDCWPGKKCPECRWLLERDVPDSFTQVESIHF